MQYQVGYLLSTLGEEGREAQDSPYATSILVPTSFATHYASEA